DSNIRRCKKARPSFDSHLPELFRADLTEDLLGRVFPVAAFCSNQPFASRLSRIGHSLLFRRRPQASTSSQSAPFTFCSESIFLSMSAILARVRSCTRSQAPIEL